MELILERDPVAEWETVGLVSVLQALTKVEPVDRVFCCCEDWDILRAASLPVCAEMYGKAAEGAQVVSFKVPIPRGTEFYGEALAKLNGWELEILPPKFGIQEEEEEGIVLCPFGTVAQMNMPVKVWKAIVRHLRSYNIPVAMMGGRGQRMDEIAFTEAEILSEYPIEKKLRVLGRAKLVVGVPNAWTWIAAGYERKIVLAYPEGVPPRRWFPWANDKFGRIIWDPARLEIPVVLAGLRQLIQML
jgi:hypothetical protein